MEGMRKMKEVAKIKNFSISEHWFKYYVYETIDGVEYYKFCFDEFKDALDYVASWVK